MPVVNERLNISTPLDCVKIPPCFRSRITVVFCIIPSLTVMVCFLSLGRWIPPMFLYSLFFRRTYG